MADSLLFNELVSAGQRRLADFCRERIVKTGSPTDDACLAAAPDRDLLAPGVFAGLAARDFRRARMCALAGSFRRGGYDALDVNADSYGRLHVPDVFDGDVGVGYSSTWYCRDHAEGFRGPSQADDHRPLWLIDDRISVARCKGVRFDRLLSKTRADLISRSLPNDVDISQPDPETVERLHTAVSVIAGSASGTHAQMVNLCRELALVDSQSVIGLSAMELHGAILIQRRPRATTLYYCEHLVHELGHLALNAVAFRNPAVFDDDPFLPRLRSPLRTDERGTYQVLHATFVLARLAEFFAEIVRSHSLDEPYGSEAVGRMALSMVGLKVGIDSLGQAPLGATGQQLLDGMRRVALAVQDEHQDQLASANLEGQSVELDVDRWLANNYPNG